MADVQARVDDYLDDKIQTAADLDGINALLTQIEEQQGLLQKQVCLLQRFGLLCLQSYSSKKLKLPDLKLRSMPKNKQAHCRHGLWTSNASRTISTND